MSRPRNAASLSRFSLYREFNTMNYTTPSPPLDWVLKRRFDSLRVFSSIKQPKISSTLRALQSAMRYLQARSCALSKNSTEDLAAIVDADEVYSIYAMRICLRSKRLVIASSVRPLHLLERVLSKAFSPAGCPLQQIMVASSSESLHF